MTVRPSLAARTKSRPPDRMRARAGIPTVRSMSARRDTPLLARLTTIARRVAAAEPGGDVAQLDGGADGRHVRGDRDEDPVGLVEDRLVERAVGRVQVDDDDVEPRRAAPIAAADPRPGRGCRCAAASRSGRRP